MYKANLPKELPEVTKRNEIRNDRVESYHSKRDTLS